MALIKCPECQREVSDSAASCPNCGKVINASNAQPAQPPKKKKKKIWLWILIIIVIFIGAGIMGSDSSNSGSSGGNQPVASPSSQEPDFTGSPSALIDAYNENEVAADKKFKGKKIRLSGRIEDIGKDILDKPYLTFASDEQFEFRSVQCYFTKKEEDKLADLRKGQNVVVQGTVDGLMMNVLMKNCWFVE